MNKNTLDLFPSFINIALTCLIGIELLLNSVALIDGEVVYTCGFFVVLYVIWAETYNVHDTLLKSQFDYSQISLFWHKYKELERINLLLISVKTKLVNEMLVLFSLTSIFLKGLNFIQFKIFEYKVLIQLLNKLKLKIKALPLQ